MTDGAVKSGWRLRLRRRFAGAAAILALQAAAAIYFVLDSVEDIIAQAQSRPTLSLVMECAVALALAVGVYLGFRHVTELRRDLRRSEQALKLARGAMAEHIATKFKGWALSPSEAEVAMLALKGFQPPEIANFRNAATGTVRSQLSQIYAKAGVTSHSMLIALFIEDQL